MEADKLAEVWQKIRDGDIHAYEWLFKKLAARLYSYGYRLVADRPTVQDTIQEVFIQLWEKRASLSDVRSVQSYLFKITRNKLLNKTTKAVTKEESLFTDVELSYEEALVTEEANQEINQKLINCLAKLTPRQREVIYLKFYQQLEYDQIADMLSIVYQASVNLCFRAITTLRECLKSKSSVN